MRGPWNKTSILTVFALSITSDLTKDYCSGSFLNQPLPCWNYMYELTHSVYVVLRVETSV